MTSGDEDAEKLEARNLPKRNESTTTHTQTYMLMIVAVLFTPAKSGVAQVSLNRSMDKQNVV